MPAMDEARNRLMARIRRCAQLAGSGEALAQKTAIPRRTLETYLSGRAEPKASRLAAIARAAGVSAHWLVTGEGPAQEPTVGGNLVTVPRFDPDEPITSGTAETSAGYRVEDLAFSRDWLKQLGLPTKGLATFTARGDAMAPTIEAGDLLLLQLLRESGEPTVPEEGIYLLRLQGSRQVKRLQNDGHGGLLVKSDNPAYETLHIEKGALDNIRILGRVLWTGRKLA
jgi:phage repressor protein C with HTH and peptisase S24 domain